MTLAALLIWLPIHAPVAILAYQSGVLSAAGTSVLVLAKDAAALALLAVLAWRHWRLVTWRWFDALALGYVGVLVVYAIVPAVLGAPVAPAGIAAAFRDFAVPVELYALGRLAAAAGVDRRTLLTGFLGVALLAAVATLLLHVLVPVDFWTRGLDLVSYVREVQGLPYARSLGDISILGHYGVGPERAIPRAVGPLVHPVAAAHYFVPALLLAAAGAFAAWQAGSRRVPAAAALIAVVFAATIIATISRGAWVAAGLGVLVCGFMYRRAVVAVLAVAAVGLFVALVPPYSLSISSAITADDSSASAHQVQIERGAESVETSPFGVGLGQTDRARRYTERAGIATTGVADSFYLSLYVAAGPLAVLTFAGWLGGVLMALLPWRRSAPESWVQVALAASLAGVAVSSVTNSIMARFTPTASLFLLAGLFLHGSLSRHARLTVPGARGVPNELPQGLAVEQPQDERQAHRELAAVRRLT